MSLTNNIRWSPPVETGLSGDAYLSELIEDHVDDLADAHQPGVYVLELSMPETGGVETYNRLWLQDHEAVPPYLESIVESTRLLYVGSAANVYERVREHLESPNRSTTVATTFPIHHVDQIWFYDGPQTARDNEQRHGIELRNQLIDAHVHCR